MKKNILILEADRSTGMNFIDSLLLDDKHDYVIYGVCTNPLRATLSNCDFKIFIENYESKSFEWITKYVEQIFDIKIDLVYQTKSAEKMIKFSQERNSIPCFLPSHESIEIFEDKLLTYNLLKKKYIEYVPATICPTNFHEIGQFHQNIQKAMWVRDLKGQAGRGSYESNDPQEIYKNIEKNKSWGNVIIAERLPKFSMSNENIVTHLSNDLLPGEMISWIALYDKGNLIASQTRKRLYWEFSELTPSGVTGYSGANMTIKRDDIHDFCDKILRDLDVDINGAMGIDMMVGEDLKLKITEIQSSRFFTSTYQLAQLGLNLPKLFLDSFFEKNEVKNLINPCPDKMIYIQRFGCEGKMVHQSEIIEDN